MNKTQHPKRFTKIYSMLFIAAFFGLLLLQLTAPGITINTIGDNFLWRNNLMGMFNTTRFRLGDQVFYLALVGKNGWFYYTGEKSIQDYQKDLRLNPKTIQKAAHSLTLLKNQITKNGGKLVILIAPDKSTIYPQYMPDKINIIGHESRMDQLIHYLQTNKSDIQVLDLRPALRKESLSSDTYYKTDTHWNCFGAYQAYQSALYEASLPGLSPHPLSDFKLYTDDKSTPGITHIMLMKKTEDSWHVTSKFLSASAITYKSIKSLSITTNLVGGHLPKALIFGDSFYRTCMNEFFEPSFRRTVATSWRLLIQNNDPLIEKEKPNLVIIEFSERFISDFLALLSNS